MPTPARLAALLLFKSGVMSDARANYQELIRSLRETALLESAGSILGWDERVNLPPKGTAFRAEQLGLLARLTHERFTSPRIGELIASVEASDLVKDPESDEAATVRELRRSYDRQTKLPTDLVEELTKTASLAEAVWVEARQKSDFKLFEPWLRRTIDLKRRQASCIGYKDNPYDALLDGYEPDETAANVARIFAGLRTSLVELVGKITSSGRTPPTAILERNYPVARQEQLARSVAGLIGFDFQSGRLDVTVHPFASGIGPGDTRITTRYDENDFGNAFFGTMHETGHALYEQGLPKDRHFGLPLGESISLGIHESQSRMWENLVGRSRAFWRFFLPQTKAMFAPTLDDVTEDQWVWAVNAVRPSLIRTEADEATYNLHIMLRFELEQALLRDEVSVGDVPAAWNERMRQYLGITPPNDAAGCLQDVHWAAGLQGYFPTYALGNLYAAQLFEQARKELGDLDAMFARGEFRPLLQWLRTNVHRHGKRYSARQLVKKVTGNDLSPDALMRHLARKAADLYGV